VKDIIKVLPRGGGGGGSFRDNEGLNKLWETVRWLAVENYQRQVRKFATKAPDRLRRNHPTPRCVKQDVLIRCYKIGFANWSLQPDMSDWFAISFYKRM
jgi:hypothetical protein